MKYCFLSAALLLAAPALAQVKHHAMADDAGYLANPTSGNLNLKYGFRDVRFDTDTAHIADLQRYAEDGLVFYRRTSDKPLVGAAHVDIRYFFTKGRFSSVSITTSNQDDSAALLAALYAMYGKEDAVGRGFEDAMPRHRTWSRQRCLMTFDFKLSGASEAIIASVAQREMFVRQVSSTAKPTPGDL